MRTSRVFFIVSVVGVSLLAGCGWGTRARIAGFLLGVSGDQKEKGALERRETANFEKARRAFEEHRQDLAALDADQARRLFGEPVTVSTRKSGGQVWGYKAAESDWFEGEKIFLTFDENGKLCSAEYIPS